MKTLYLDCGMGAAGDMLTAALLELLPDPDAFLEELNALGLPKVRFERETTEKCAVTGTHVHVWVGEEEEAPSYSAGAGEVLKETLHSLSHKAGHFWSHLTGAGHSHEHSHEHNHEHGHNSLADIRAVFEGIPVSDKARGDILAVYDILANAEAKVHSSSPEGVHFHEVGAADAMADIAAVCLLMERLSPDRVVVSPIRTGFGQVRCAHGILPVPTPATAEILQGMPVYAGDIRGEMITPTGAALLKHFAAEYGGMPAMTQEKTGYGMGTKDFPAANCVRAVFGDAAEGTKAVCSAGREDEILELSCNLDDMTGEDLGYALEKLMSEGALDAFTQPIGMKKSRPGTMLTVLCRVEDREKMVSELFRNTTTLGVREKTCRRYILDRSMLEADTSYGKIRCKVSEGYGVRRVKPEYDDLKKAAGESGAGLKEIRKAAEDALR